MNEVKLWVDRVLECGGMLGMEELNEGFRISLMLDELLANPVETEPMGEEQCCLQRGRSATETTSASR